MEYVNTATFVLDSDTTISSNSVTAYSAGFVTLTKTQSQEYVSSGDTMTYNFTLTNSGSAILNKVFKDTLPTGMTYVINSFKINGIIATPTIVSQTISYRIPVLNNGSAISIELKVTID